MIFKKNVIFILFERQIEIETHRQIDRNFPFVDSPLKCPWQTGLAVVKPATQNPVHDFRWVAEPLPASP